MCRMVEAAGLDVGANREVWKKQTNDYFEMIDELEWRASYEGGRDRSVKIVAKQDVVLQGYEGTGDSLANAVVSSHRCEYCGVCYPDRTGLDLHMRKNGRSQGCQAVTGVLEFPLDLSQMMQVRHYHPTRNTPYSNRWHCVGCGYTGSGGHTGKPKRGLYDHTLLCGNALEETVQKSLLRAPMEAFMMRYRVLHSE